MTDFVAKLQSAMKQQSDDLRDELNELKNWQSTINEKSANVKKKFQNQAKAQEIFASDSTTPPVRYTPEFARATNGASSSSSADSSSKSGIGGGGAGSRNGADVVNECKDRGNAYFSRGQYEDAIRAYTQGLDADPTSPLCSVIYANRALSALKLRRWDEAEKDATSSIGLNRTNAKAFYRRALARKQLGQLKEAKTDLDTVQVLVPGDADSAKEIELVNVMIADRAKNENKEHLANNGGSSALSSSSSPAASVSPKRKKLVIQEVSDEEDEVAAEEQAKRDDKLRKEMKDAEDKKASERKAQAQQEEAQRAKQRKANPRVEIVSDDEDAAAVSNKSQQSEPAAAIPAARAATTTASANRHADPSPPSATAPPASSSASSAAASASNSPASASGKKAASPSTAASSSSASQPRKLQVNVFTPESVPCPANFAELERIFNEVTGKQDVVKALVAKIAASNTADAISKLMGSNLTNEMYTEFLRGAADADSAETTQRMVVGLSKVKVIADIVMFAGDGDAALVKACLSKCASSSLLSASEKAAVEKTLLA